MGRPSKLTDAQWEEVKRRHLAGESLGSLEREFRISRQAIQKKIGDSIVAVKSVANQLVSSEAALRKLPTQDKLLALSLADDLRAISSHLASAAKYGSATAHRLSALAHSEVAKIDDADPLQSMEALRGVAALTKMANDSSVIGVNLLAANKDRMRESERPNVPSSLAHFYGEDEDGQEAHA